MCDASEIPNNYQDELLTLRQQIADLHQERARDQQERDALRAERDAFRIIADGAYDWEYWLAPDGTLRYVSPACERITGYRPNEFQADPGLLERIVHPDDRTQVNNHLHAACQLQQTCAMEFRIITSSGTERWIGHACHPVYSQDGEWQGQRASHRDITAQKQAEADLCNEHLRFERGPVVIISWEERPEWPVCFVSPNIDQFGYTPDDLIQQAPSFLSLVHPDDRDRVCAEIQQLRATNAPPLTRQDYRLICADGSVRHIADFSRPVYDHTGAIVRVDGYLLDVTDQKQAEADQAHALALARATVESATGGVLVTTSEGSVITFNQRFVDLFQLPAGWEQIDNVHERLALVLHRIADPEAFLHRTEEIWHASEQDSYDVIPLRDGRIVSRHSTPFRLYEQVIGRLWSYRDITEHKKMEAALRESEARWRALVENINDVMFTLDTAGTFTYISPVIERIAGYRPREVIGQPFQQFVYPDDFPMLQERFTQTLRGIVKPSEFRIIAKDHALVYVRTSSRPVVEHQQVVGLTGVLSNITERKQAEKALSESQALLQAILDNAAVGISLVTPQGEYLHINRRITEMFGYTLEELAEKTVWDLTHPDDLQMSQVQARELLLNEIAGYRLEKRYVRKDGSMFWGELSISTVRNETHDITHVVGIITDITERKQAEAALRTSEERYTRAVTAGQVGVWEWNLTTNEMYLAPNLKAILGYADHEIRNHLDDWGRFVHPDDQELVMAAAAAYLRGEIDTYNVEHRMLHKDGSVRWMVVRGSVFHDALGNPIRMVGTDTDITERKRMEEALRESEARYRAMFERNQAVKLLIDSMTGAIVNANPAASDFFGYDLETLRAMKITDINQLPPEQVQAEMQRASQEQRTYFVFQHRLASGEIRDVEVHSSPLEMGGRQLLYSIIHDITERKQAEEALHESRALLQGVLDNAPLVIVVKDRDGRYILANHWAAANLNLKPEQMIGKTEAAWFPPAYVEAFLDSDRQVWATGQTVTVEDTAILLDTGVHTYLAVKFPVTNVQGEITAVGAIATDITERKQLEQALHQRVQQLEALRETMQQITSELNLDALLHAILQRAIGLVNGASGQVLLYDADQHDLMVLACTNMMPGLIGTRQPLTERATGQVIRTRQPLVIADYQTWEDRLPQYAHLGAHTLLLLPLLAGDQVLGILIIGYSDPDRSFDEHAINLLTLFAQQATIALRNAQLFADMRHLAIMDPLTRLHNRRYLDETLPRELRRATRQAQPMGIIMLDIDHFKRFNDTYGHDAGDTLLRAVGAFLKAHTRGEDIACRYGGEEFLLVLPGASLADTQQRAEDLRTGVQTVAVKHRGQALTQVTVSLGVAVFPEHGATADELIRTADQALYWAKHSGRNYVVVARRMLDEP